MAQASQAHPSSNSLQDLDKWASLRLYQRIGMKLPRWPMMLLEHSGSGDFVVVVAVDQYSFPSGHAARVSALAAFAYVCCAHQSWGLVIAAAAWAVTVAVSRAAMGRHYLGDITAGLLLGLVTVAIVTKGTFSSRGFWIERATSEKLQQQALETMGGWLSRWKPA
ncbi:hypothetical protein WJX73_009700 [Symbiochloris irregularis]|uniref:Phosphatidic acid phosphatase type 2/haloperoxidase domain-containing protein n=1 Tax=Symbiochloris irregularis TaxID=706552 RepID=A0AAW1NNB5_9CHLO